MDFKQLIKLEIQLEKMILMFSVKILQFGYISPGHCTMGRGGVVSKGHKGACY